MTFNQICEKVANKKSKQQNIWTKVVKSCESCDQLDILSKSLELKVVSQGKH